MLHQGGLGGTKRRTATLAYHRRQRPRGYSAGDVRSGEVVKAYRPREETISASGIYVRFVRNAMSFSTRKTKTPPPPPPPHPPPARHAHLSGAWAR